MQSKAEIVSQANQLIKSLQQREQVSSRGNYYGVELKVSRRKSSINQRMEVYWDTLGCTCIMEVQWDA